MVVIAVAGGTGDVGRTVVEEIVRTGKHKVLVLGRQLPKGHGDDDPEFVVVNYDDIEGTARALERNNVHTVVSAMFVMGPAEQSQLNLIEAAGQSPTTHRFIPSEFGGYVADGDFDENDVMRAPTIRARQALSKTGLKTTYLSIGLFMDYFGQPNIPSTLRPFKWALDVPSKRAVIPGTGDEVFSVTYSRDVARFVARLVDDADWPRFSCISGSDTCLNEIVRISETVTGDKFQVVYDSPEDVKAGKATPIEPDAESYGGMDAAATAALAGNFVLNGAFVTPKEARLNERYPDIRPMSIEEMLKTAWSEK